MIALSVTGRCFDVRTVQYCSSPYDNLINWLGTNRWDDSNEYDVVLSSDVVERVAVLYLLQEIGLDDTISESADGLGVARGGVTLI